MHMVMYINYNTTISEKDHALANIEYRKMSTKITNEYKKIAKSEKKYARDQKWIQNEYITGKGKPILEKVSQLVFIHWFNRLLW